MDIGKSEKLASFGLAVHSFNLSAYNNLVDEKYTIESNLDNLVHLIVSRPDYFEKGVIPFIKQASETACDPVDSAAKAILTDLFPNDDIIFDYEMRPNRIPKMLMQTACHVAGAAAFYQKSDCDQNRLPDNLKDKKLMGCCIHPLYGGYFSMRAAILTKSEEKVIPTMPPKTLDHDEIKDLLIEFNTDWTAGKWRDYGKPIDKYSSTALEYFNTIPSKRKPLIDKIKQL